MASNHVVGRSESNQRQLELNQWNVSNSMKHWWDLGYEARNSPRPDQISLRPKPFSRKKLFKPKRKNAASSPDIESHIKEGKHKQMVIDIADIDEEVIIKISLNFHPGLSQSPHFECKGYSSQYLKQSQQ